MNVVVLLIELQAEPLKRREKRRKQLTSRADHTKEEGTDADED